MKILSMQYFSGRNIYAHRPVLKITLDMGEYYKRETTDFEHFAENLIKGLPSLSNHHCSRGKPGGFLERVKEGTYLSHVAEHVILELMAQGGQDVIWGKTFYSGKGKKYFIVCECYVREAGEKAARIAVDFVRATAKGEKYPLTSEVNELRAFTAKYGHGPSTAAILAACKKRQIPFLELPGGYIQLAYGKKQRRIFGTLTQVESCLNCDVASDKNLTKAFLADAGVPVPRGKLVRSEDEALLAAEELGFPVTVKPNNGNHGRGVSVNLNSKAEVRAAFKVAYMYDKEIILEKYLRGKHFRLLVIGGKLKACAERVAPRVIGDGKSTVKELIEKLNADPRRGEGHGNIRSRIVLDPELILTISKQHRCLEDILPDGEVLILRENANLSSGAGAEDVTAFVHPTIAACAETAAKVVGLNIAGVDLVAENISKPISEQDVAIIEVNASPGLRMHLHPDGGEGQAVGDEIVKFLFPEKRKWHIPLVSITGTNGKTTTTRLIGAALAKAGECVGMTTTGGIYIQGKCILKGDTTGPESAKTVLKHPDVTAAVLETARGGILRAGLGYDLADVAVITNITEDHLGQDGIETLADLAHVKALVAEAVRKDGTVVLNADDDYCVNYVRKRTRSKLIYFSILPDNPIVCRHLAAGGEALFIKCENVVYAKGDEMETICSISDIPLTYGGRAVHNVYNVLAGVSAMKALGLKNGLIAETLQSFGRSPQDNPGRLHIENVDGIQVIIDYGHNLAGFQWTAEFARKLNPRRLLAVVGVPGDRNNESIVKIGNFAGQAFDEIWIKEDSDLRGRMPGEVAELLYSGAKQKLDFKKIHITLQETKAVRDALSQAKSGDIVLVFYEHFEPVLQTVKNFFDLSMTVEAWH